MTEKAFEKKVIAIVYNTIKQYQKNPRFDKHPLELYDNWKDVIVDRIIKLAKKYKYEGR